MARILTGIQSTGTPHLGNILGAILPAIEQSSKKDNEAFFFIADLHSLTQLKNGLELKENTYSVAAAWLALGFDEERNVFYRQSDLAPQVCELAWYLNCFTPYPMLANAHSFKEKADRLSDVNGGLFTYPVLMAADIIGYRANFVPVGKDQQQHLEMCRDIALSFNHKMGEVFVIPEGLYNEQTMIIPGTDRKKMSKSYGNVINVFSTDKVLRKQVMSIITDSTPVEAPKDPEKCNVFKLFSLLASDVAREELRSNYLSGNYGYGQAKQALFELICKRFGEARKRYRELIEDKDYLDEILAKGATRARTTIRSVIEKTRRVCGY